MRLRGKAALITGAGQGIGRATALIFAKEGAKVVVVDIDPKWGKETADMIQKSRGEAIFIQADVSKAQDAKRMIEACVEKYGKIDILFNNAGVVKGGPSSDTITELTEEDWDRIISINLKGVFLGCKYAVPHMIKQGSGSIINAGSIAGVVARSGQLGYSTSKGGVVLMTKQIALDLAKYNVRVNATCPGFTSTPLVKSMTDSQPDMKHLWESWHPMNRFATPEEVAYAALYLASDESSFVTGTTLLVDGGFTAGR